MTEALLAALIVILIAGIALLYFKLSNSKPQDSGSSEALQFLQNQINQMTNNQDEKFDRMQATLRDQQQILNQQLDKSNTSLLQQFESSRKAVKETSDSTAKIIKEVTEKLTKLDDTNKQVVGFAEQLQSLENILKNPKQRGILGEYFLESVLKSVLPPDSYEIQYRFANGEAVDAYVKTRDGGIPIDAKFSLENYNKSVNAENASDKEKYNNEFKKDLKKRIDETAKYIRPEEGTLDFAFMFIPADGLYYELLVKRVGASSVSSQDLTSYAFSKKVIIVSPTTFFAYLQTVYQGLRALKIEESAKEIQSNVGKLQTHLKNYEDNFRKLGNHIGNTVSSYNSAAKELTKVDKDMIKITGDAKLSINVEENEKPIDYLMD